MGDPLSLAESSRRLGACIWLEERLFEVLGAWARSDLPAELRLQLAEQSRHHAWRAGQLRERLPEVPGFAAADVVGPSDPGVAATLDTLAGAPATIDAVVAVHEVLVPGLVAAYVDHLDRATPVTDAAVARTVQIVLADLRDDAALGAAQVDASTL